MNIALVPARSGSKGVPKKNIKLLGGFPLIAYSILAAKQCKNIDKVIVSTNSEIISKIASYYGAEVPFRRPEVFASDTATGYDVIKHFCDWYLETNGVLPDLITQLLPTTPLRDYKVIDHAIDIMLKQDVTSLRSAHKLPEPPQKMMQIIDGYFAGFFPDNLRPEYWNLPRQTFPIAYHPNGYVEIIRPGIIYSSIHSMFGDYIYPLITPYLTEIDFPEDFEYLEYIIRTKGHKLHKLLQEKF